MPDKKTLARAQKDKEEGKAPTTQAGEFIREEMHHIREGKHGAANTRQAIAIGLSKARRAGVDLPPPSEGQADERTIKSAKSARRRRGRKPSSRRSRATSRALKRQPRSAASHRAVSRQARATAKRRGPRKRSQAAKKAARTRAQRR